MAITWRNINGPNWSASNNLLNTGIDSLKSGFKDVSNIQNNIDANKAAYDEAQANQRMGALQEQSQITQNSIAAQEDAVFSSMNSAKLQGLIANNRQTTLENNNLPTKFTDAHTTAVTGNTATKARTKQAADNYTLDKNAFEFDKLHKGKVLQQRSAQNTATNKLQRYSNVTSRMNANTTRKNSKGSSGGADNKALLLLQQMYNKSDKSEATQAKVRSGLIAAGVPLNKIKDMYTNITGKDVKLPKAEKIKGVNVDDAIKNLGADLVDTTDKQQYNDWVVSGKEQGLKGTDLYNYVKKGYDGAWFPWSSPDYDALN